MSCKYPDFQAGEIVISGSDKQTNSGSLALSAGDLVLNEFTITCTAKEIGDMAKIVQINFSETGTTVQKADLYIYIGTASFGGLSAGDTIVSGSNTYDSFFVEPIVTADYSVHSLTNYSNALISVDKYIKTSTSTVTLYCCVVAVGAETYLATSSQKCEIYTKVM